MDASNFIKKAWNRPLNLNINSNRQHASQLQPRNHATNLDQEFRRSGASRKFRISTQHTDKNLI